MRRLAPLFIISAASLLTACGGGGSDNSAGAPAGGQSTGSSTSLTGRFVDGPVSGLRYSTPTSNGRTNANGEFTYRQGETVSFFIGDVLIGQAPGAATITPFSLAGTTPPTSTLDIVKAVRLVNAHRVNANNTATPLEVAGNIATFLQTVDSDGDPANGIQVPAAMDGLTTGKSIDFRQTFSRFKIDVGVQALIAAGRSAGVWSGSRTLKDPFLALDALYSGLGISAAIQATSSIAFDTGGNGSVDSIVTKTYDAQGHVIREDTTDATGKLTLSVTATYDQDGRKLAEQRDNNADGTPDAVTTFIYDANGVLTRLESSAPTATAADFIYENGRLIRIDSRDASNTLTAQTKFSYTNGNLTKQEEDTKADGVTDNTTINTYDASGHLLTSSFDGGANGSASDTYTYDANDNVITQVHSRDGKVSLNITSTYDANANPTLIQFTHPADSRTDYQQTYEYNADGTLKTFKKILANGSVEFSADYNYTSTDNWAAAGWVQ